ncbi:MAG: P-loop NTPase fold protein [Treponema sp.]|uniref:KAP family P-loop NTPase fold protein n=1 Tax=Treponema sp. TaxID=166 RepID=UPI002A9150BA|nr:P-loop NTPase fold protein [Treponema sp.]MDY6396239.1 P-loop NTPase fold protein [Treponema sp.]
MKKLTYENDKPEKKTDYLDYKIFAKNLKNSLYSLPTELGFTCAIDGEWGIGKTTLINFIKEEIYIDEKPKYKIVDYSPWNIIDSQKSLNEFFAILNNNIKNAESDSKIEKIIKNYYKLLIEGVKLIPKVSKFSALIDFIVNFFDSTQDNKENTVSSTKKELYDYMRYEYNGDDLLIIIDDVDRLDGNEIIMLMKLIKEIADLPHITYLLSLDRNNVANAINHYYNYPEDNNYGFVYLDKFVQLWWSVPIIEETKINDYLTDKIKTIIPKDLFDYEEEYFNQICKNIIFYKDDITLRKLKLLINSFTNNYQKMCIYTNFCDLLAYTWLQLFYPDLLTFIVQNVDLLLYDKRSEAGLLDANQKDSQEKENIENNKARFDNIAKSKRQEYSKILHTLFPILKYNLGITYYPDTKENAIMRFLICESENFTNYFYQKKSTFIDTYNEIENIISSENTNSILTALENNSIYIKNFTNYMYLYCEYKKPKVNLFPVLQALFIFGNKLKENDSHFLIGNILNYFYPSQEKSLDLFIDIIDKTLFKEIDKFLIYLLYSFIVFQKLLLNYNQSEQKKLLDSFYNQLQLNGFKNENMINYRRVCDIYSKSNRFDIINKLFDLSIDFLIAYIINVYEELEKKSNTNEIFSFRNYYKNNTSGYVFNIDNFWKFINQDVAQVIVNKSNEIKLYKQSTNFNNLENEYQLIINTYISDFNL